MMLRQVSMVTVAALLLAVAWPAAVAAEDTQVALAQAGTVMVLNDHNFEAVASQREVLMINFFAGWCRFSQMLKPVYQQTAAVLADAPAALLGSVDCEAPNTAALRERFHINKYPTIKVLRRGVPLKTEYRGQRSPSALSAYVHELLQEAVAEVVDQAEIEDHINVSVKERCRQRKA